MSAARLTAQCINQLLSRLSLEDKKELMNIMSNEDKEELVSVMSNEDKKLLMSSLSIDDVLSNMYCISEYVWSEDDYASDDDSLAFDVPLMIIQAKDFDDAAFKLARNDIARRKFESKCCRWLNDLSIVDINNINSRISGKSKITLAGLMEMYDSIRHKIIKTVEVEQLDDNMWYLFMLSRSIVVINNIISTC
jgi:hypothetical protein